jgi:hypothetical protein
MLIKEPMNPGGRFGSEHSARYEPVRHGEMFRALQSPIRSGCVSNTGTSWGLCTRRNNFEDVLNLRGSCPQLSHQLAGRRSVCVAVDTCPRRMLGQHVGRTGIQQPPLRDDCSRHTCLRYWPTRFRLVIARGCVVYFRCGHDRTLSRGSRTQ